MLERRKLGNASEATLGLEEGVAKRLLPGLRAASRGV